MIFMVTLFLMGEEINLHRLTNRTVLTLNNGFGGSRKGYLESIDGFCREGEKVKID